MANPRKPVVKVIDFGFAEISMNKLKLYCGTPSFMSPEVASKTPYIGPPSDIWAAGIILFNMLFGFQPFKGSNEQELYREISRCNYNLPKTTIKMQKNQNDWTAGVSSAF